MRCTRNGQALADGAPHVVVSTLGTEHDGTSEITAATNVGVSTVEGTACDHFAFRQKDVDWELWIEQGAIA